jgi:hypothetical protein
MDTHMLHVWYIYLQNWVIFKANVGINIPAPWSIWNITYYKNNVYIYIIYMLYIYIIHIYGISDPAASFNPKIAERFGHLRG